jgi:hypothetical protein
VDLYRLGQERAAGFANELYAILDEGRTLILVEWACYGAFLKDDITVAMQIEFAPASASEAGFPADVKGSEPRVIALTANRALNLNFPPIAPDLPPLEQEALEQ